MTLANFMLKATERQYRHHMDKLMKNKYRSIPPRIDMFNPQSDYSNSGYGFVLYKQLIRYAYHPTAISNGTTVVVWDVAFFLCDFVDRFELYLCNRLDTETNIVKKFKTEHERACYMEEIGVEFNKNNRMISIVVPESHIWTAKYGQMLRKKQLNDELKEINP